MSHQAGAFTLTVMFDQGHLQLVIIDPSEFHFLLQHDNTREHYLFMGGAVKPRRYKLLAKGNCMYCTITRVEDVTLWQLAINP